MKNEEKDKGHLIREITALRRRVEELEGASHLQDLEAKRELKSSKDKYLIILENMEEAYF